MKTDMDRTVIETDKAPAAIGSYVQANKIGNFVFTSGQIPLDPTTGKISGNTAEEQAARALENLKAVLEAAGSSMENVIKTTVFLSDIDDFSAVNGVYSKFFTGKQLPSRSAVAVANLPMNAKVEIEAIAIANDML